MEETEEDEEEREKRKEGSIEKVRNSGGDGVSGRSVRREEEKVGAKNGGGKRGIKKCEK